jgi:hypothetical protein
MLVFCRTQVGAVTVMATSQTSTINDPVPNNGRMAGVLNSMDWDDTGPITPLVLLPGQLPPRRSTKL